MSCWARHAFAYTGQLTDGTALAPREIPRVLREGRAHGAGAARWHQRGETLLAAIEAADALRSSLNADEAEMAEAGVQISVADRIEVEANLLDIFAHYLRTVEPLGNLTRLEDELIVPIPSRTGVKGSTRYRFQCFIDGWTVDDAGRPWLVEFKLRKRLHPVELIQLAPQIRWYAWALERVKGISPVGVIIDETLNLAPRPPRLVKAKRKGEGIDGYTISHAKDQLTTVALYLEACRDYEVESDPATVAALNEIVWHQRVPIIFREGEIAEAGRELVSAAKLIRDLDSGELEPIRHATPMTCSNCRFKRICANPADDLFIDTLFERVEPKRYRELEVA